MKSCEGFFEVFGEKDKIKINFVSIAINNKSKAISI